MVPRLQPRTWLVAASNKGTGTACLLVVVAVLIALNAVASAAEPVAPALPPPTWEQWTKSFKNPRPWFVWGADLRLRNEYFNGALTLSDTAPRHEQDYLRYRGRVWGTASSPARVSVHARVSAEPRSWRKDSYSSAFGPKTGMEGRYGLFDNLYVKWADAFGAPITISVGRQDVQFGDPLEWWLAADGTPGDGSWTFFLDSARVTWDHKASGTKLDVVGIKQSARPDRWLPVFGHSSYRGFDYTVTDQDEKGVIVYLATKPARHTTFDTYWIYKQDDRAQIRKGGVPSWSGDNARLSTFGARLAGTPAEHWRYSAEAAWQTGSKQDSINDGPGGVARFAERDVAAYGFTGKVTWLRKDVRNTQASLMAEFLSGDDPGTSGRDEMFDVLWGRWPGWSEMYIYSYAHETGGRIAQLNNVGRLGGQWKWALGKNDTLSLTYNALFAPRSVPSRRLGSVAAAFTNTGHFRGNYAQAILRHTFSKSATGHLWAECLWKGDYYQQRRTMVFLRAEILFTL